MTPTTPTTPTAPTAPTGWHAPSGGGGGLALTGIDVLGAAIIGGLVLAVGALVLIATRRGARVDQRPGICNLQRRN